MTCKKKKKETSAMAIKYLSKYFSKLSQYSCVRELHLSPISIVLISQNFSCVLLSINQTISKSTSELFQLSFISMLQCLNLSNAAEYSYAIQNMYTGDFTTSCFSSFNFILFASFLKNNPVNSIKSSTLIFSK